MKKLLLLLCVIFISISGFSQSVCGGTFTDSGGANGNYASAEDITTTICPTNSTDLVTVTFTSFNTEATWDGLYVFDGNSITSPQIASTNPAGNVPGGLAGSFWGTIIPGPFVSSTPGGCLTFRFRSDGSINNPGWVANVTCAPAPVCSKPILLTTTAITTNSVTVGWTQAQNPDGSTATAWEILALPCGSPIPTAATTGFISASTNPFTFSGLNSDTCYCFYLKAVCSSTEKSVWSNSVCITTFPSPPACGGIFSDLGGVSANYPNNADSTTTICPINTGEVVTVTFTSFNVQANADGLYVYDGNSTTSPQIASSNGTGTVPGGLAGSYWGTTIPGFFTSSSADGCLTFRFRSGATVNATGWVANVSCSPPPVCAIPILLTTAEITTNSVNIGWTQPQNPDGSTANVSEIVALPCGSTIPTASATGFITTPNNPFTYSGLNSGTCYCFYVRAVCTSTEKSNWSNSICISTLFSPPACGGNFVDSGGTTANYANNEDVTTTICPTNPNELVTVTFSIFNSEANWDGLYVFNGNSVNASQISSTNDAGNVPGGLAGSFWGNLTGSNLPGPFESSSPDGCLTFRFRSDGSVNNPGWVANVTCASSDRIILNAFVDLDNNGIKDAGEEDFNHGNFLYDINNSGTNTLAYSPTGNYVITDSNATNSYSFGYQLQPEFATYYNAVLTTYNSITIPTASGSQILYFPILLTQPFNDVTISIAPLSPPRPGFTYTNRIVYKNNGVSTATSGTITFVKPTLVTTVTTTQTGTTGNATGFTYNYTNLLPNETRSFYVTMTVPASPTVNVNNLLTNTATISTTGTDINTINNSASNSQIVVNSYDPNDKIEAHGDKIEFSQFSVNDYLKYTIRFENTGTANAINVRLNDILDSRIDATSVRMLSASHDYKMDRIGSNLTWKFDNIQLPVSVVNTQIGKGYVTFEVKLNPGFASGDIIPNTANIFFDTNPAITTNTFNTKFISSLVTTSFNDAGFIIYPNPADVFITIQLSNSNINEIIIYDTLGKVLFKEKNIESNQKNIDVSSFLKGMYLVEIELGNNSKTFKKLLIK